MNGKPDPHDSSFHRRVSNNGTKQPIIDEEVSLQKNQRRIASTLDVSVCSAIYNHFRLGVQSLPHSDFIPIDGQLRKCKSSNNFSVLLKNPQSFQLSGSDWQKNKCFSNASESNKNLRLKEMSNENQEIADRKSLANHQAVYHHSPPIIKVRSKIYDLNRSILMPHHQSTAKSSHLNLSSSSGCSTQSSSSSAASAFDTLNLSGDHMLKNINRKDDSHRCSLTSSSSFSSGTSQSSLSNRTNSRVSLRETAQNFFDFIENYEQSLIQCLSTVDHVNNEKEVKNDNTENSISCPCSKCSSTKINHEKLPKVGVSDDTVIDNYPENHNDDENCLHQNTYIHGHLIHHENDTSIQKKPVLHKIETCHSANQNDVLYRNSAIIHSSHGDEDKSSYGLMEECLINGTDDSNDLFRRSLRLQLKKVRELRDQYDRGFRCTEAIEKLQKLTNNQKNCNREWRANERMLASIANQLESLIGSFQIRIDEIEGWARICPRDTYEIEFRHGRQRQVLRVKIGKNLERIWDLGKREVTFRGSLQPIILCRVREVKSGWRSLAVWTKRHVEIGITSLAMSELLESVSKKCPILLDANASGSLKLRIVCQWNPMVDSTRQSQQQEVTVFANNGNNSLQNCNKDNQIKPTNSCINRDLARSLLTLPTFLSHDDATGNSLYFPQVAIPDPLLDRDEVESDQYQCSMIHPISSTNPISVSKQVKSILNILSTLQTSLEDYGGHAVEITLVSQSVTRLMTLYQQLDDKIATISNDFPQNVYRNETDDQASAVIEEAFGFLDENYGHQSLEENEYFSTDSDDEEEGKIVASFDTNDYISKVSGQQKNQLTSYQLENKNSHVPSHFFLMDMSDWNQILQLHLISAMNQLNYVGSWILKSREKWALSRLKVDAFAMEQIYRIIQEMENNAKQSHLSDDYTIGRDPRVLEFWDFLCKRQTSSGLKRFIFSHDHLCSLISQMVSSYLNLNTAESSVEMIDIFNNCAEWLITWLMVGDTMVVANQPEWITIFNIRAFFELKLCQNYSINETQMKLRNFFQIALDLSRLTRMKNRKISVFQVEQILFKSFNIDCCWIPSDLTLLLITLLYEHHCNQEIKNRSNMGPTRSQTANNVKKNDRLRELSKIINNWLGWLLEESRFEIRDHILSGLESYCPLTRRASCYGITCLVRLAKRIYERKQRSGSLNRAPCLSNIALMFQGQEMDCLLYISLEDSDSRVRDEARRALKCLGSFGQQRLNQVERTKMGFCLSSSVSSTSLSSQRLNHEISMSPSINQGSHNYCKSKIKRHAVPYIGASLPNLNLSKT